jgi:hypothetical protein
MNRNPNPAVIAKANAKWPALNALQLITFDIFDLLIAQRIDLPDPRIFLKFYTNNALITTGDKLVQLRIFY